MNKRVVKNIIIKEWYLTLHDMNSSMLITVLPLLVIGQMILVIFLVFRFTNLSEISIGLILNSIDVAAKTFPFISQLPLREQLLSLMIMQMPLYMLLIPVMIGIYFATFSIIEEKTQRTLEPLLATPASTEDILLAKGLSALIPAYAMTLICYVITVSAVGLIFGFQHTRILLSYIWLMGVIFLSPLLGLLAFLLGVMTSAKHTDVKQAQNFSLFIIFPIFGLIGLQFTGIIPLNALTILGYIAVLILIDYLLLKSAVSVFSRSKILTNWK